MKLVITFPCGSEYVASWTGTICIEYESEEKLLLDIEEWSEVNKNKLFIYSDSGFKGTDLFPENFLDNYKDGWFTIRTLDKWFDDESFV